MTYIFVLAGCLLGFIGLVFGWRAARWTLAAILFVPLFLVGYVFLLPLLWEPGGPFVAAAPPAPDAAAAQASQAAPTAPNQWFYITTIHGTGEPVTHGPFPTYDAAIADCEAVKLSGTCGGYWFWRTDQPAPIPPQPAAQPTLPILPGLKIGDPDAAAAQASQAAASQPEALPIIPGLKIGDPDACGLPFGRPCPDPQAERTDTPAEKAAAQPRSSDTYQKALQALTGENLTPLN